MLVGLSATGREVYMKPLVLVFPVVLAAARSLTLGVRSRSSPENPPIISTEDERRFLKAAILILLCFWVTLYLMMRFPDAGLLIATYNQF
jgi:hypothetical protein